MNTATRKASAVLFATAWAFLCLSLPSESRAEDGITNIINGTTVGFTGNWMEGTNGAFNGLIVTNAGVLAVTGSGIIGNSSLSSNNNAFVTGSGSLWSNSVNLHVGNTGSFNQLTIANGGQVFNTTGYVGYASYASNNGVLITGAGSAWTNISDLYVGYSGSGNQLTIANGGRTVNRNGYIAGDASASNNAAIVTGPGSIWSSSSALEVGLYGSSNSLTIANGGRAISSAANVGTWTGANNNLLVVSDAGSLFMTVSLYQMGVGRSGAGNWMIITNGAQAVSSGWGFIGYDVSASNNAAIVTGNGSLWSNAINLEVGSFGSFNRLTIANSGQVLGGVAHIGRYTSASNNAVTVTGSGSVWSNSTFLYVGNSGASNNLTIANSGRVFSSNGNIGNNASASNNAVTVTGPGSLWNNSDSLIVGNQAGGNQLTIINSGQVVSGRGWVGSTLSASNNSVLVSGTGSIWNCRGLLVIGSNGSTNNGLIIANGGSVFSATGVVNYSGGSDNWVLVTGAGSLWTNKGVLILGSNGGGGRLNIDDGGSVAASNVFIGYDTGANSNGITVTGSGSALNNGGYLYVGYSGSFNQVTIQNGGVVTNAGEVIIGNNKSASNNILQVTDAGSLLSVGSRLIVGYSGAFNRLTIASGSRVFNTDGYVGYGSSGSNNTVLVDGSGSIWSNSGSLYIGRSSKANELIVTNGARVLNNIGYLGYMTAIVNNNKVLVSGTGSLWANSGDLYIGDQGWRNEMTINNGGVVSSANASIGSYMAISIQSRNKVVVDGSGSAWKVNGTLCMARRGEVNALTILNSGNVAITGDFQEGTESDGGSSFITVDGTGSILNVGAEIAIGGAGYGNKLQITNGGTLLCDSGVLGSQSHAYNNTATVTGNGSLWSNHFLQVGRLGRVSSLTVSDNGTVVAGTLLIGSNSPSSNNSLIVSGGNVFVTNAAANGLFDVRRGTFEMSSGTVIADRLLVTNFANSIVNINGGSLTAPMLLNAGQFTMAGGTLSVPGAFTNAAGGTFNLSGGSVFVPLRMNNMGTFIQSGGFFDPAVFTNSGTFTLSGGTNMAATFINLASGIVEQSGGEHDVNAATNFGLWTISGGAANLTNFVNETNGSLILSNGMLNGTVLLASNSWLRGAGTINGNVTSSGGIALGFSAGNLIVNGNLTLLGDSLLQMELAGTDDWLYDQINLAGTLNFGGALTLSLLDGFSPLVGDRFDLFDFSSSSGFFSSTNLPSLAAGLVWDTSLLYSSGEIEAEQAPILLSAVSRKVHSTAGPFDLNLNLNPALSGTIEPRRYGPTELLFAFNKDMRAADGTLDASEFTLTNATFVSASIISSNLTLSLTNVVDQAKVTVVLNGISDLAGNALVGTNAVVIRSLYGDLNQSGSVSVSDLQYVKNRLLQPVDTLNFLADPNLTGTISVSDLQTVKNNLLHSVPLGGFNPITPPLQFSTAPTFDLPVPAATLGEALGAPELDWNTNGDEVWSPTIAPDGSTAAWSGSIGDLSVSWVETTVTGPGTLSFDWRVSSELDADLLTFSIDGIDEPGRISGEVGWQPLTVSITSGSHRLRWTYGKNRDGAAGYDAGWLRRVSYSPTP